MVDLSGSQTRKMTGPGVYGNGPWECKELERAVPYERAGEAGSAKEDRGAGPQVEGQAAGARLGRPAGDLLHAAAAELAPGDDEGDALFEVGGGNGAAAERTGDALVGAAEET